MYTEYTYIYMYVRVQFKRVGGGRVHCECEVIPLKSVRVTRRISAARHLVSGRHWRPSPSIDIPALLVNDANVTTAELGANGQFLEMLIPPAAAERYCAQSRENS
jgi:hypothetical protein